MIEILERRRAVLQKQRDKLLTELQEIETVDSLGNISAELWEIRSRLIVYGDFEIMGDPPADFAEMWKGIEIENLDQLRKWITRKISTANRIISDDGSDLTIGERDLLKKQGIAVKNELEIVLSLIGEIYPPKVIFPKEFRR